MGLLFCWLVLVLQVVSSASPLDAATQALHSVENSFILFC
jgi:hypothetical protein